MRSSITFIAARRLGLLLVIGLAFLAGPATQAQDPPPPVRLAIIGLTHDHVGGFIPRLDGRTDVQLVGIVETNQEVIAHYSKRFDLASNLFYPSIAKLFAKTNVQAVATFTSTFDHKRVVEACAPHGVAVMMEKPLAVNMKHARAIAAAAQKAGIPIIVNYETTWYPAIQAAFAMIQDQHQIGQVRKIVAHDGHRGPKEIGCPPEFLAWLTDPVLNGGGALMDFGCYGADLVTVLMEGRPPDSVLACTRHFKPDVYPKVEDDATIVLDYPQTEAILEPSWNWPIAVKDLEVYGQTGYIKAPNGTSLRTRSGKETVDTEIKPPAVTGVNADPVSYLVAVTRGEIKPAGLSSLEINIVVTEILDAARESARAGQRVKLSPH